MATALHFAGGVLKGAHGDPELPTFHRILVTGSTATAIGIETAPIITAGVQFFLGFSQAS